MKLYSAWGFKMKLYLAARYSRKNELSIYKEILENNGFTITSRWLLDSSRSLDDENASPSELRSIALIDYMDVKAADGLVAFTEPSGNTYGRGGRHVELGIALEAQKDVVVVGYRENIFCWHPSVVYVPTVRDFLTWVCPNMTKNHRAILQNLGILIP